MSDFDRDVEWTPHPDSPIAIKAMSWRLNINIMELVESLGGAEKFDMTAFEHGGYSDVRRIKYHLKGNKCCPVVRKPESHPSASSRTIDIAAFGETSLYKRCENCNRRFAEAHAAKEKGHH
jgi:hypothetical protein